jgi:thymidylate kinase
MVPAGDAAVKRVAAARGGEKGENLLKYKGSQDDDMPTFLTITALLAVVAALIAARSRGRRKAGRMEQQDTNAEEKIRAIYERAAARVAALRKERHDIVDRFIKRADDLRIAEEKKKLQDL